LLVLDFINYLRILYASYVFAIFNLPKNNPFIDKSQFLKALHEDRLPNFFQESEVNTLYDLISLNPLMNSDTMNFATFAFFLNLNRLFHRYSNERPQHLNKAELMKIIRHPLAPAAVAQAIDKSEVKFTTKDYKEASLYLQQKKPQESDFFYRFNEPQNFLIQLSHANSTENEEARKMFFKVMVEADKKYWNKKIFYSAFQLSNLFVSLTMDLRLFVSVTQLLNTLPSFYETVNPRINLKQRSNLSFYKTLPREMYIDLITFLEVENYSNKYVATTIGTQETSISETLLKVIMKDYGMSEITDDIIDVARIGFDKLKRRIYGAQKVMHVLMVVQSVAAELRRTVNTWKTAKIKENKNPNREYPIADRRLKGSILV